MDACEFYWKWFRLLVVHFQAVDILGQYVTGANFRPGTPISIRILSPPHVDDKLLPWRELITDNKFLPRTSSIRVGRQRSNAQILDFLEEGVKDISKWSSAVLGAKKAWADNSVDETIKQITLLQSSPLPGWGTTANKLLQMLQAPIEDQSRSHITDMISALSDSIWLFTFLDSKSRFTGALHCEASLASLISLKNAPNTHPDSKFAVLLAKVKVIMCFQLVLAIAYLCIHSLLDLLSGYPNFAARYVKHSWTS